MKGDSRQPGGWRRRIRWVAAAAVIAYLAFGFYQVHPGERGVVRWLGRIPDSQKRQGGVLPGVHYALPWPICRLEKPKTTEVRRVYVGQTPEQREAIIRGTIDAIAASPQTDMLTGDVNILKLTMVVQYQVSDPVAYLTGTEDPDKLVRDTVQAALIQTLAALSVDRALTTAKIELQEETVRQAQERLDKYDCGVSLTSATLESIEPPRAVINSFQEVVSAKKDGERSVDQAIAEANTILPQARGQAQQTLQEAEAYKASKVSQATGDADRFLSLLAEYAKAPRVTRDRLRLQAFERILPRVRVFVVDNKEGDKPVDIKIIDAARGKGE